VAREGSAPPATARLGLEYGTVRLARDDAGAWAAAYERLAARVRAALGELAVDVQHVGSTAVPGLVAKPILDVAVRLRDGADVKAVRERLEALAHEYRGDMGDRGGILFVVNERPWFRVAHVHVVRHGDPQWERYLAFRDVLLADPAAREAYTALKHELAERYAGDRTAYTAGKDPLIGELLARP
jgi:GrpB-like predicted nucleotidyltransferase (UPF0157 family)